MTRGAAAVRLDGEGEGEDDLFAPATLEEASIQNAKIVRAINAGGSTADARRARAAVQGVCLDAIRERAFAALAGRDQVRGVIVQLVTCARRGPRVRIRAWLDTGAIVTVEQDEEGASTSPCHLAAAIVVAVDRASTFST